MDSVPCSPVGELRKKRLVWHYTTLETLQLILESKSLLATEVNYQNDPREPSTAINAVEEALAFFAGDKVYGRFALAASRWFADYRDRNGFVSGHSGDLLGQSRFIFCASTDPDSLYAWRTYSSSSRTGCAIGIDPDAPFGVVAPGMVGRSVEMSQWSEVIYRESDLRDFTVETLKEVADEWVEQDREDQADAEQQEKDGVPEWEISVYRAFGVLVTQFSKAASKIAAVAKHSSFIDEKEARLTASDISQGIVFSPGYDGPRPRVKLAATTNWGDVVTTPTKPLPIRAIVLAPDAREQAMTTAHWLLYANEYPIDPVMEIDESGSEPFLYADSSRTVSVFRSEHPYRNV